MERFSSSYFLNFHSICTLGWISLCSGRQSWALSGVQSYPWPLPTSCQWHFPIPPIVVTTENISRHCQMFPCVCACAHARVQVLTQLTPAAQMNGAQLSYPLTFNRGNPKPFPIEKHGYPVHSLQKETYNFPWLLAFSSEILKLIPFSASPWSELMAQYLHLNTKY